MNYLKQNKYFIMTIFILLIFAIGHIFPLTYITYYQNSYFNAGIFNHEVLEGAIPLIIFKQFIILCFAFLLGILLQLPFAKRYGSELLIFSAYPLGIVAWIFFVYSIGLLNLPLNILLCYVIPLILAFLWAIFGRKILMDNGSNAGAVNKKYTLMICFVIVLFFFAIISVFPQYWINDGDAARSIEIAENALINGKLTVGLYSFTTRSIYGSTVHLLARMLGLNFSYTHIWALGMTGIILLALVLIRIAQHNGVRKGMAIFMSILSILAIISSGGMRLHFRWLMSNLPIGICLGTFVALLFLYSKTEIRYHFSLALPFFFMFAFARIEGPLYALLFLVLARKLFPSKKAHYFCTVIFTAIAVVQFILYCIYMGSGGATFWNPLRGSVIPLTSIAYLGFLHLADRKMPKFLLVHMNILCTIGLGIINMLLFALNPPKASHNILVMRYHLFMSDEHGSIWYLFLLAIIMVMLIKDKKFKKQINLLIIFVGNYVLAVLALMSQFNWTPLPDVGESGGRMLIHVEFVIIIIVFMVLIGIAPKPGRE
ncbi:MAG: hypothetical protein FWG91_09620 [Lachnospiraceae bacterium]|nr:hypothetical protein [Lachnospiraceae bacterium]